MFLNGQAARVSPGLTLAQFVTRQDPDLGAALDAGAAIATDARGVPADPAVVLTAGAIYRVFRSARGSAHA